MVKGGSVRGLVGKISPTGSRRETPAALARRRCRHQRRGSVGGLRRLRCGRSGETLHASRRRLVGASDWRSGARPRAALICRTLTCPACSRKSGARARQPERRRVQGPKNIEPRLRLLGSSDQIDVHPRVSDPALRPAVPGILRAVGVTPPLPTCRSCGGGCEGHDYMISSNLVSRQIINPARSLHAEWPAQAHPTGKSSKQGRRRAGTPME